MLGAGAQCVSTEGLAKTLPLPQESGSPVGRAGPGKGAGGRWRPLPGLWGSPRLCPQDAGGIFARGPSRCPVGSSATEFCALPFEAGEAKPRSAASLLQHRDERFPYSSDRLGLSGARSAPRTFAPAPKASSSRVLRQCLLRRGAPGKLSKKCPWALWPMLSQCPCLRK